MKNQTVLHIQEAGAFLQTGAPLNPYHLHNIPMQQQEEQKETHGEHKGCKSW